MVAHQPERAWRGRPGCSRPLTRHHDDLIHVAEDPVLPRFEGLHQGMLRSVEVLGRVAVLGLESQQPTWPQTRHSLRCTQVSPIRRQSSQPWAEGWTSWIWSRCVQFVAMPFLLLSGRRSSGQR